jgi:hypothetical protein
MVHQPDESSLGTVEKRRHTYDPVDERERLDRLIQLTLLLGVVQVYAAVDCRSFQVRGGLTSRGDPQYPQDTRHCQLDQNPTRDSTTSEEVDRNPKQTPTQRNRQKSFHLFQSRTQGNSIRKSIMDIHWTERDQGQHRHRDAERRVIRRLNDEAAIEILQEGYQPSAETEVDDGEQEDDRECDDAREPEETHFRCRSCR